MKGCHAGRDFIVQPEDRRRFSAQVERGDGCWRWTGCQQHGYGRFKIANDKSAKLAHRVSYVIHKGRIPSGMLVMHTCDNGLCVNPAHLVVGTQSDNLADMHRKGRWVPGKRRRKTVCKRGHSLTDGNAREYTTKDGKTSRYCVTCADIWTRTKNAATHERRATEAAEAMHAHVGEYLPDSFQTLVTMTDMRRADAFCSNYGVFGHSPATLTQIAERYGITRERTRQIVNDVLIALGIPLHRRRYVHAA